MAQKPTVNVISESEFTVKGHGVHTAYVELTAALKKVNRYKVSINTHHKTDIIHIHTIGFFALRFLLTRGSKKVITAHLVPESFLGSLIAARYWLPIIRVYMRWFYNLADEVLAVSDETKRQLEKIGITRPIEVFYNVIDTKRYASDQRQKIHARRKLGIAEDAWVVIGAGQVQPRKRLDSFIAVARELPDVHFIWVGGMPFKKMAANNGEMQRLMHEAPKNVHFPGIIELEDMPVYYRASDVFFLPSSQETFGLVIVEAAAAGLPILLRDIHDYDETFRRYGVMADDKTFGKSIVKLRDNPKYYAAMAKYAHQLAKKYDSLRAAQRLCDMYDRLLDR